MIDILNGPPHSKCQMPLRKRGRGECHSDVEDVPDAGWRQKGQPEEPVHQMRLPCIPITLQTCCFLK